MRKGLVNFLNIYMQEETYFLNFQFSHVNSIYKTETSVPTLFPSLLKHCTNPLEKKITGFPAVFNNK